MRSLLPIVLLAAVAPAQVVINEVYYDAPVGDDGQVFVELFGPAGFDISGWTIRSIEGGGSSAGGCNPDNFTFPAGTLIPADGFVVVADADGTGNTLVANADFVVGDIDLENGADAVQLLDAAGLYVDAIAYGAVNTAVGNASACNGQPWFEGNPARDVFAPLSIERVPAGTDTDDNATDFTPNAPTPGTAAVCTDAMERVGNSSISSTSGSVGFDIWLEPCGANRDYIILIALSDPAIVPPPLGLPVFDDSSFLWVDAVTAGAPFVSFFGTLDAQGHSVGQARLDFTLAPVPLGTSFDMWLGAVAYDLALNIDATNSLQITITP